MEKTIIFSNSNYQTKFSNHLRVLGYSLLGYPHNLKPDDFLELQTLIRHLRLKNSVENVQDLRPLKQYSTIIMECVLGKGPKKYSCLEL